MPTNAPQLTLPAVSQSAGLAVALIATALALGGERLVLVAGLFLIGAALVRYGVVDRIEQSTRVPLWRWSTWARRPALRHS
jgi:hypothetical protein